MNENQKPTTKTRIYNLIILDKDSRYLSTMASMYKCFAMLQ